VNKRKTTAWFLGVCATLFTLAATGSLGLQWTMKGDIADVAGAVEDNGQRLDRMEGRHMKAYDELEARHTKDYNGFDDRLRAMEMGP